MAHGTGPDFTFTVGAVTAQVVTVTTTLANRSDTFTGLTCEVFVTSDAFRQAGAVGGLAGADAFCQARADAGIGNGTLPDGKCVAFLSTASTDAGDRIADVGYGLADGTPVAASKADLLDSSLLHAINTDAWGVTLVIAGVWTGSTESGTAGSSTALTEGTGRAPAMAPVPSAARRGRPIGDRRGQ